MAKRQNKTNTAKAPTSSSASRRSGGRVSRARCMSERWIGSSCPAAHIAYLWDRHEFAVDLLEKMVTLLQVDSRVGIGRNGQRAFIEFGKEGRAKTGTDNQCESEKQSRQSHHQDGGDDGARAGAGDDPRQDALSLQFPDHANMEQPE